MRKVQLFCLSATFVVALSGTAEAAPTLIWSTYSQNTLSAADATGGNGRDLFAGSAFPVAVDAPNGNAVDAARGKVFWANTDGADGIYSGNLYDTSEAPCLIVSGANTGPFPLSMSYDPTSSVLYWYEDVFGAPSTIRYVQIPSNCSGATPSTLYTESQYPAQMKEVNGIAIDPANNRLYWANGTDGTVGYANLDGSTPANSAGLIDPTACNLTVANSVNVDSAANRLYVGAFDASNNSVLAVSDLDGGNCVSSVVGLQSAGGAWGVSRNSDTLFLGNYGDGKIDTWPISSFPSSPAVLVPGGTATIAEAQFPNMLDVPVGNAAVSPATAEAGAELTCSSTWSVGSPGMQWYRAPQTKTYSWSKDGVPIPGATNATFKPDSAGQYTCNVTGTNYAGSKTFTASATVTAPPSPAPPGPTSPKLKVSLTTPKKVTGGKSFGVKLKVTNRAGEVATSRAVSPRAGVEARSVKTCLTVPSPLITIKAKGSKINGRTACWTRSTLGSGKSVTYSATVKAPRSARGSKSLKATVQASDTAGDVVNVTGRAKVKVKKAEPPKPKPPTG